MDTWKVYVKEKIPWAVSLWSAWKKKAHDKKYQAESLAAVKAAFHTEDIRSIQLAEEDLGRLTYKDFEHLSYVVPYETYNHFLQMVQEWNVSRLKRKDTVKISFVMYDASMWCGDTLYTLLKNDGRFDVDVILCLRNDVATDTAREAFEKGAEQFRKRGITVRVVYPEEEFALDTDVLFYLAPYFEVLHDSLTPEHIPMSVLICYVDYGIALANGFTASDIPIRRFTWHEFMDMKTHLAVLQQSAYRHGEGCLYTGYPRMDTFYEESQPDYTWKMVSPKAKKIIWAPHWSIKTGYLYATFHKNWEFFLDYAKTHPDTTSWVVKPHPNLMDSAVEAGVFASDKEFRAYLDEWNSLPNAKVETGGYYQDIFKTSDAMILDSCSFTAEYLYEHKPELFLTRKIDSFNAVGHAILDSIYTADGADFKKIQSFIDDVIIGEHDPKREETEATFRKYLDYVSDNGKLASEKIYAVLKEELTRTEPC